MSDKTNIDCYSELLSNAYLNYTGVHFNDRECKELFGLLQRARESYFSLKQEYIDNIHMKIIDDLKDHYWNSLSEDKDLIIDHATKVIDKVFENY